MTFDISKYVEFDTKGRATCPSCLTDGKTAKNLSVLESGAYKCHRGCLPQQIKDALGYTADRTLPPPSSPPAKPAKNVMVSPEKVKAATEQLLNHGTHALRWLTDRGITSEMIQRYRLGVVRSKVGDSSKATKSTHLPAIAVSIPNADGTAYYQKKRIRPWVPKEEQPDGYQAWSQYGIPRMVYTTHQPETPTQTWLTEGEWDAMLLGHFVRNSELKNDIQVSCFTCGAGNVPQMETLEQLPGTVTVWYDLDEPGQKGAAKVQNLLKERCKVATVPHPEAPAEGWDVSDALNAGLWADFTTKATEAKAWEPKKKDNPLRDRLVTNDELLATAPDYTDWLVDDILTADELFLLAASPRAGKSLLAFTLAKAVATGGKFMGRPASQGAVIYVRCEDSDTKTKERELKQGWTEGMPVYWLDKFKLSELNHLDELVEELGARLVVFDTLSRIRDSAISESSAEMSQLLEPLQEMCKRQRCTGLLVHHTGKVNVNNAGDTDIFETIRGSSAIRATCRGTMVLAADERNYRLCVENGWNKMDLQILLDANTLEWRLLGNWHGPEVDLSQRDRVLAYLTQVGSAKLDQIAQETNLPKRSLYEVLKRLQADDLVEKRGDQRAAVYVKKALQQVQQLNSLLKSGNPDDESIRGSVQQNIFSSPPTEKVILNSKSDQNNDHFSPETPPPTPGDLLNSEPKPLQVKGLQVQQLFNTSSTRVQQPTEVWLYCTELETAVRLDKKGVHASTVYVPGMGTQQFNNEFLKPIENPAVELEVEDHANG
ncbi:MULTISPECIES: AAA family ATPase [Cyanophyceae]|nr:MULTISPECIES: AAA family ATPase [Cyanophyceae]MBD1917184.1 AAA family ATPase [Phormidium sp. FACHB-77]MBD2030715.1 AAA family ATPase [Phormidium sp. FACHB-322]MBD2050177.1 AAA family ATPase [Leptolyngbya sp. FACHB-60]